MYIYIWYPPQSPHLSCSGITSNANSTLVSRVRVHNRRCNRENPKFPKAFRAKIEPAQYYYWTRGSDR